MELEKVPYISEVEFTVDAVGRAVFVLPCGHQRAMLPMDQTWADRRCSTCTMQYRIKLGTYSKRATVWARW